MLGGEAHDALESMGEVGEPLKAKYGRHPKSIAPRMGRAHEAIGKLLEYLGRRVIAELRDGTDAPAPAPTMLADVPPPGGGRFICLDLSAYADPLYTRFSRTAYGSHQKSALTGILPGAPFVCLPRRARSLSSLLRVRGNLGEAIELSQEDHAGIPAVGVAGLLQWIDDYRRSRLASIHELYYQGWHDDPADWARTYDRLDLSSLPPDVSSVLERPNPGLLKPSRMRDVLVELVRRGWHPRSVAGLIRSKFERDFGWGAYWYRYDAAARADFYVRVLWGDMLAPAAEVSRRADHAPRE
jgi:hypothetical protein